MTAQAAPALDEGVAVAVEPTRRWRNTMSAPVTSPWHIVTGRRPSGVPAAWSRSSKDLSEEEPNDSRRPAAARPAGPPE